MKQVLFSNDFVRDYQGLPESMVGTHDLLRTP
jgi:hypothetical protein